MQPDGSFVFGKDKAPFKFDGAVLVAGDRRVSIDEKGIIVGGQDTDNMKFRVEGATDDGAKRTALFALALVLMGGAGPDDGASAPPAQP
jgi:hypothetical protein